MRARFVLWTLLAGCTGSVDPSPDNLAPSSPEIRISPSKPRTADDVSVIVLTPSVDPDGDAVTLHYRWAMDHDPQPELDDASEVPADRTERGEVWEISVFGEDSRGAQGEPVVTSVRIDNTPPRISLAVLPDPPGAGQDFELVVTAEDADSDDVSTALSWTVDDVEVPTQNGRTTVPGSSTSRGQVWKVEALPSDDRDDGEPETLEVTIADGPPVVDSVVLTPSNPQEGSVLSVTASATDPEGDAVSFEYRWWVGANQLIGQTSATLDGASFDKGNVVRAEVTAVSDQGGRSAPTSSNLVTVLNTPPTVVSASVSPGAGNEATVFSCVGSGLADVDPADTPTTQASWLVNDAVAAATPTLNGTRFSRGDSVACRLTPTDNVAMGPAQTSAAVVIGNAPPMLASVTLGPAGASAGASVTATPGPSSDLDGDTVSYSYAWTVNGQPVAGTSASLSTVGLRRGDRIQVSATPNDGRDPGAAVLSAELVLANAPPEITSLTFSPASPNAFVDLTVVPVTTDPDGDGVGTSFAWTVNGGGVGAIGPTLGHHTYSRGATVAVTVFADDGHGGAVSRQASVVIGDAPPTAPTVTLDPFDPLSGDDLLCQLAGGATDPDGDAVTHSFRWRVDGVSYNQAESGVGYSQVSYLDTRPGETWTCSAVASDGTLSTIGPVQSVLIRPVTCIANAHDNGIGVCACNGGYSWCDGTQAACCYTPPTSFDITVVRATVTATDGSGVAWDLIGGGFGSPDVFVRLLVSSVNLGETSVVSDSLTPIWNRLFSGIAVGNAESARFELRDDDFLSTEYMTSFTLTYAELVSHVDQGDFTLQNGIATSFVLRVVGH